MEFYREFFNQKKVSTNVTLVQQLNPLVNHFLKFCLGFPDHNQVHHSMLGIHPLLPITFQLPDASVTFRTAFFRKTQFNLDNVIILNDQVRGVFFNLGLSNGNFGQVSLQPYLKVFLLFRFGKRERLRVPFVKHAVNTSDIILPRL